MNLNDLRINDYGIVESVDQIGLPMKLVEFGFLPKTMFKIKAKAPFKGPILIEFGEQSNRVAIGWDQASLIRIQKK